jgi:pimeloyl-ACP methyl ester carboxylesterase
MAATDPQTGYASVNGLNMFYEFHGSGRPLVLLHGALSTTEVDFGAMLPSLAKTRQVIAVEQQAHGHTDDLDVLLAFYDYPALRHEAPHDRVGVRDPHRWAVAAA